MPSKKPSRLRRIIEYWVELRKQGIDTQRTSKVWKPFYLGQGGPLFVFPGWSDTERIPYVSGAYWDAERKTWAAFCTCQGFFYAGQDKTRTDLCRHIDEWTAEVQLLTQGRSPKGPMGKLADYWNIGGRNTVRRRPPDVRGKGR